MRERPIIALIGRPNVGKSTLFNRLIGRRVAITSPHAGTTRDRNFGVMQWHANSWTVVDTAGLIEPRQSDSSETLLAAIEEQINLAVGDADLVVVVTDVNSGIHPSERALVARLKKSNKHMCILVNKADNPVTGAQASQFYALGVEAVFPVSAIHGRGIHDWVEWLKQNFPSPTDNRESKVSGVALIGRPNVGKSSLVNRLVGKNRVVVSPVSGTTRDAIDVECSISDETTVILIDTAGFKRRGKTHPGIEKYSLMRAIRAVNRADLVVILISIEEPPTRGDAHIAQFALDAGKRVVLALTKADLVHPSVFRLPDNKRQDLGSQYLRRFAFLQRLPHVFVSARTGEGIDDLKAHIARLT